MNKQNRIINEIEDTINKLVKKRPKVKATKQTFTLYAIVGGIFRRKGYVEKSNLADLREWELIAQGLGTYVAEIPDEHVKKVFTLLAISAYDFIQQTSPRDAVEIESIIDEAEDLGLFMVEISSTIPDTFVCVPPPDPLDAYITKEIEKQAEELLGAIASRK
jgi:hypothetical protein